MVCAQYKEVVEKTPSWSEIDVFVFISHRSSTPFLFILASARIQNLLPNFIAQLYSRVDAIRRFAFPTVCNRLRLALRSSFFSAQLVNAFLLFRL